MGLSDAPFGLDADDRCLLPTGGSVTGSTATSSGSIAGNLTSADFETLRQDPANWTMAAGNYASTRFSRLDEINTGNVARLKVAWTFSTGMVAGHEAAPLVVRHLCPQS